MLKKREQTISKGNDLPPIHLYPAQPLPLEDPDITLSVICKLIASGQADNKASLGRLTGLSRTTVSSRVEYLERKGIVASEGVIVAKRGRPASRLVISADLGLLAIGDIGAEHTIIAIADMNLRLLGYRRMHIKLSEHEPDELLEQVGLDMKSMAQELRPGAHLCHCALAFPGRIDNKIRRFFRPPIMPAWDMYNAQKKMSTIMGCSVSLDNDVNVRALGEAAVLPGNERPIVAVKIATGIGAGIICARDRILHGYDGSAGEIGHTCFDPNNTRPCRCGMTGCLEANAAVPAIIEAYNSRGPQQRIETVEDLIDCLRSGDAIAHELVVAAGSSVGQAIAYVCNILNPRRVIVSGLLVDSCDELLTQIRTSVYGRTRPLASRNLVVERSSIGPLAGVVGCMVKGVSETLSPEAMAW